MEIQLSTSHVIEWLAAHGLPHLHGDTSLWGVLKKNKDEKIDVSIWQGNTGFALLGLQLTCIFLHWNKYDTKWKGYYH